MHVARRLALLVLFTISPAWGATIYLDGNLSSNCSGSSYNIAARNCSGSDGRAYDSMSGALGALNGGDTLIIRPGRYSRIRMGGGHSGSSNNPTIVRTLPGEEREAIICAHTDRCTSYPPSTSYSEAAILLLAASWIEVHGLKTYGMCVPAGGSYGHDILMDGMDCGGGGPGGGSDWNVARSQPMVLGCKNGERITVRNSKIHHSGTSADAPHNASCYMQYDCGDILLENLDVYSCRDNGLFIKDGGGRGDVTLRNIMTSDVGNDGVRGFNQDPIDGVLRIENSVGNVDLVNAGSGYQAGGGVVIDRLNGSVSDAPSSAQITNLGQADLSLVGVNWDSSSSGPQCGNGVRESGETCDGGDLGGQTCVSQGFDGGTLACSSGCGGFDTDGCVINDDGGSSTLPAVSGLQRGDISAGGGGGNSGPGPDPDPDPNAGEVFFDEGWESGNGSGTFNSDHFGSFEGRSQLTVQSSEVAAGNFAARHRYPSGGGGQYATQFFGDASATPVWPDGAGEHYLDLYIQFKVKYSSGFSWSAGNNKQFIIGTQDNRDHGNVCCNPWVSHYITLHARSDGAFHAEGNNKQNEGSQWIELSPNVNGYSNGNPYDIQTGRWYTVQIRRRLNDSGQDNGIFQMWIDGEKVAEYTSIRYRVPWTGSVGANMTYGTNYIMMSNYINGGSPQDQSVYYDDIRMSTSYIPD